MMTPMQLRIAAAGGGVPAAIITKDDTDNYDPRVPGAYTPFPTDSTPVAGIYEKLPQTGQAASIRAKFMFYAGEPLPLLESESAKVLVDGILYLAKNVRRRFYLRKMDGYSLDLENGQPG